MAADAYDRFWRARGAASEPPEDFPFALVPSAPGAGASAGAAGGPPSPRAAFGPAGGPELAVPLALDASGVQDGSPKLWLALARASAAAGCGLVLSPDVLSARADVLRAARVVTFLSVGPGAATPPPAARGARALLLRLADPEGAPAILEAGALPAWVEAARALSGYQVPVALSIPPGRRPAWWALNEARAAGLDAVSFEEGKRPSAEPLAARFGRAAQAAAAGGDLACLLGANEPPDAVTACSLLAAGARTIITPGPVEAAVRAEASFSGDWKAHGDALAHAIAALWAGACAAARSAGCSDPRDLTRDNLRALTYDAAALSGARLAGFDERLPWWVH